MSARSPAPSAEFRAEQEERLAAANLLGYRAYFQDPNGDPRAPYDGRTRLGKAWYAGWRAAMNAAFADRFPSTKEAGDE